MAQNQAFLFLIFTLTGVIIGVLFDLDIYFDDALYPFQSKIAKIRIEDFIAREEIEMNIFLSSFLEDM